MSLRDAQAARAYRKRYALFQKTSERVGKTFEMTENRTFQIATATVVTVYFVMSYNLLENNSFGVVQDEQLNCQYTYGQRENSQYLCEPIRIVA